MNSKKPETSTPLEKISFAQMIAKDALLNNGECRGSRFRVDDRGEMHIERSWFRVILLRDFSEVGLEVYGNDWLVYEGTSGR
jgi:hypothetical protein